METKLQALRRLARQLSAGQSHAARRSSTAIRHLYTDRLKATGVEASEEYRRWTNYTYMQLLGRDADGIRQAAGVDDNAIARDYLDSKAQAQVFEVEDIVARSEPTDLKTAHDRAIEAVKNA